jgi:hypothetical protein
MGDFCQGMLTGCTQIRGEFMLRACRIPLRHVLFAALAACLLSARGQSPGEAYPELHSPRFRITPLPGLSVQEGISRRDPSDVIKVGGQYYVWYTKVHNGPGVFMYPSGYSGSIWFATSPDGFHWTERAESVRTGTDSGFDGGGVFTPNILVARGKYFLFYTAVRTPIASDHPTAIGLAVASSPLGPWNKYPQNPVLVPSSDPAQFDSFRIDDACLLKRDGKFWLYYKGRQQGHTPLETKWGVAIATSPSGPYRKYSGNPVTTSGHEVLVWPDRNGVAALIGPVGPQKNTIQYAADGLHFSVISGIVSPPMAPGAWRPQAFTDTHDAEPIHWGISMRDGPNPYLVRFEYEYGTAVNMTPAR